MVIQSVPRAGKRLSQAAEPALRNAWKVNLLDLNFRGVTAVTLAMMLGLCGFVLAVLPRARHRTRQTDAIEYAIVVLLTVMFSPLSFNYAYVWLIYPMTLGLHLVMSEPPGASGHRIRVGWIIAVFLIPALALPMPLLAQAYGNLFVPALLLLLGLGVMLRATCRNEEDAKDHGRIRRMFRMVTIIPGRSRRLSDRRLLQAIVQAKRPVWDCLFSGFGQECRHHLKRGIQREGTRRMDRKRIAVAI